jgi:hypothetical protein
MKEHIPSPMYTMKTYKLTNISTHLMNVITLYVHLHTHHMEMKNIYIYILIEDQIQINFIFIIVNKDHEQILFQNKQPIFKSIKY